MAKRQFVTPQLVNIELARKFFKTACDAFKKGDMELFTAARAMMLLNLGLTSTGGPQ